MRYWSGLTKRGKAIAIPPVSGKATQFAIALILSVASARVFADDSHTYITDEIRVDFPGTFAERDKAGSTVYGELLPRPEKTVDFCEWQPQPPEVQQVMRPDTGYLCELHIMPAITASQIILRIEKAARQPRPDHARTFNIQRVDIGGRSVVRWRFQAGKTRLDHFMVFGKRRNYLFVSSPYGSNGAIEQILSRIILR